MANMTIGPAFLVAGNEVQMTTKGKIQVTNAEGKVKTLSQDQFKKQLVKNADKIAAGEEIEFKDGKKGLIAGAAVGAAVIGALTALGIAAHKKVLNPMEIAKEDVLLKKAAKKVNNFAELIGRKVDDYATRAFNAVKDFIAKYAPKAEEKAAKVEEKIEEAAEKVAEK